MVLSTSPIMISSTRVCRHQSFPVILTQRLPKSIVICMRFYAHLGNLLFLIELQKTTYFSQALLIDYTGTKAVELFVNAHPTAAARNFNDIVAMVILHAPTIVPLTSNLGYSNAMATTSISCAFVAPTDEVALAQLIAKSHKELAALKKRNGTSAAFALPHPPPASKTRTG
eukprot:gene50290-67344_t